MDEHEPVENLTDEQWKSIVDRMDKIIEDSKRNEDVINAIYDFIEPYDRRVNEFKRKGKTNG